MPACLLSQCSIFRSTALVGCYESMGNPNAVSLTHCASVTSHQYVIVQLLDSAILVFRSESYCKPKDDREGEEESGRQMHARPLSSDLDLSVFLSSSFSFETSFVLPYVIHEYLDGPDEDFSIVAVTFIVSPSLFFIFCCLLECSFAGYSLCILDPA